MKYKKQLNLIHSNSQTKVQRYVNLSKSIFQANDWSRIQIQSFTVSIDVFIIWIQWEREKDGGWGTETMSHLYPLLCTPHKLSKMTWNSRMKVLIPFYKGYRKKYRKYFFYKIFFHQNTNISSKRKINCQLCHHHIQDNYVWLSL